MFSESPEVLNHFVKFDDGFELRCTGKYLPRKNALLKLGLSSGLSSDGLGFPDIAHLKETVHLRREFSNKNLIWLRLVLKFIFAIYSSSMKLAMASPII